MKILSKNDPQGALDLQILKALAQLGSMHGYGVALHIQRASGERLRIEEGSLYPALHRMALNGWVRSEWAETENNRRAKYYRLTAEGRRQLAKAEKSWAGLVEGMQALLRYA